MKIRGRVIGIDEMKKQAVILTGKVDSCEQGCENCRKCEVEELEVHVNNNIGSRIGDFVEAEVSSKTSITSIWYMYAFLLGVLILTFNSFMLFGYHIINVAVAIASMGAWLIGFRYVWKKNKEKVLGNIEKVICSAE